jgi:hypothetical protein
MTKYVILGHGNFDASSTEHLPEVLVPPGTKLQFFADTGQIFSQDVGYAAMAAKIWDELEVFGRPLGPGGVTNNYTLTPDYTDQDRESARRVDWGGAIPYFIESGRINLCTGTADNCPTPKLNVAVSRHDELRRKGPQAVAAYKKWLDYGGSGKLPVEISDFALRLADVPENLYKYVADGVPPDRWKHHCTGILGKLGGEGNELFWLCCAQITGSDLPKMPAFHSTTVPGPGGSERGQDTVDQMRRKSFVANKSSVKQAINRMTPKNEGGTFTPQSDTDAPPDTTTLQTYVGGTVVIIGMKRMPGWVDYVNRQKDAAEGETAIRRHSDGQITVKVTGFSAQAQSLVEAQMDKILQELASELSAQAPLDGKVSSGADTGAKGRATAPSAGAQGVADANPTAAKGMATASPATAQGIGDAAEIGLGAVAGSKEVARAVKLLKLAEQEPIDPFRKLAIWRLIDGLADGVRAAAESVLSSMTSK